MYWSKSFIFQKLDSINIEVKKETWWSLLSWRYSEGSQVVTIVKQCSETIMELRELESPYEIRHGWSFQQDGRVCFGDVKLFSGGDADRKTHFDPLEYMLQ